MEIELSCDSLAPTTKNINIMGVLESRKLSNKLFEYYDSKITHKAIVKPLCIKREETINYAIFCVENLVSYTDI